MSIRAGKALLALAAVLLAASVLLPAALGAEADHPLRAILSGEAIEPPPNEEQFKDACGVAVDSAGDVYVADYYQNRIVIFSKKLAYLTQINGVDPLNAAGSAPIGGPCDLAVDSQGNLYVNDYHQDVVRYTPAAYPPQLHTTYGQKTTIDQANSTGVAVDPQTDRIYVDDRTYIAVYEPNGEAVMQGGEPLRIGEGSLTDAYAVAISAFPATKGTLYVADAATETVKAYDPAISLQVPQLELYGESTTEGRFYLTDTDIAVDPADGHIYLANNLEPHFEEAPEMVIDEFSPEGFYRGPVPRSFAAGVHSFLNSAEPSGLAIAEGNLYATSGNYEKAIVAIFGPPAPFEAELLTLKKSGSGEGSVSSIPGGIGCGPACEGEFERGATVVLKATPAPGSQLGAWSGCDSLPAANRCAVKMNAPRTVEVQFEPAPQAAAPLALSAAPTPTTTTASIAAQAEAPAAKPTHAKHHHHRRRARR